MIYKALFAATLLIAIVDEFHCTKCGYPTCSEAWMKQKSPGKVKMDVNFEDDTFEKTFAKHENKLPFEWTVKFGYDENSDLEIGICFTESNETLFKNIYQTYFPVLIEIIHPSLENKAINVRPVRPSHDDLEDQCNVSPTGVAKKDVLGYTKNGQASVELTFNPCFAQCRDEYTKSNGILIWPIHSDLNKMFLNDNAKVYDGPVFYSSPSLIRLIPYAQIVNDTEVIKMTIGLFVIPGPFYEGRENEATLLVKVEILDQNDDVIQENMLEDKPFVGYSTELTINEKDIGLNIKIRLEAIDSNNIN